MCEIQISITKFHKSFQESCMQLLAPSPSRKLEFLLSICKLFKTQKLRLY